MPWRSVRIPRVSCTSIEDVLVKKAAILLILCLIAHGFAKPLPLHGNERVPARVLENSKPRSPLDPENLKAQLSYVRDKGESGNGWPRTLEYLHRVYNFSTDSFQEEDRVFTIRKKPERIIPHAVGVAEILWAICPRERIIAFNQFSTDPTFCILADQVREKGNIVLQTQTERIIGLKPDIVFTVSYSDATFKKKLTNANIPFFDLGYFGTVESLKNQILLLGQIIGEQGNANALVTLMDKKIRELRARIPPSPRPVRVLYYDKRGYIPGSRTNFNSICDLIDAVNVGAEQGVKSWSQIDSETVLKWDPDIIIVPEGGNLKERLKRNPVIAHARAVKNNKVYSIPWVYMAINSQYVILSANLLAGMVYGESHEAGGP